MSDIETLARVVADTFAQNLDQMRINIDTTGMNASYILALIDAINDAYGAAGIELKSVKVDPGVNDAVVVSR